MRTTTTEMRTLLDSEALTLTTCWKITRTDGQVFYLTESAEDISFGGDTYLSSDTYDRSAIESSTDLSADNLEIFSILNSGSITNEDLTLGYFDYAQVEVFLVDWNDPDGTGAMDLKTGRLGEVKPLQNGEGFTAELLGQTHKLEANLETVITAECSADLGDSKCKIPIVVADRANDRDYALGDYVRVRTQTLGYTGTTELLENGDFSADGDGRTLINSQAPEGWEGGGGLTFVGLLDQPEDELLPAYITHHISGGFDQYNYWQLRDIVGDNITATDIDDGRVWFYFSVWVRYDSNDPSQVTVQFEDDLETIISVPIDTGMVAVEDHPFNPNPGSDTEEWFNINTLVKGIPSGSRKVRVELRQGQFGTAANDIEYAFAEAKVIAFDNTVSSEWDYEGTIYRCTTAGTSASSEPTFDPTTGAETTDGTAVFTAEPAYRVPAIALTSVGESNFRIITDFDTRIESEARWLDDGIIFWLDGNNAGRAMEIKTQLYEGESVSEIETWLPLAKAPVIGEYGLVHPGCSRTRTDCRDKFSNILNFRGFPDLPGNDFASKFHGTR